MADKDNKKTNVFSLIKDIYFKLDKDFDKLLEECKTEAEKKNLRRDYIIARSNYRKSMNLQFDTNDPIVKDLSNELEALNKRIDKDIKGMSNVSNVLKMISEAVKVASAIVVIVMSMV